jgi:hypothetical protein
MKTLIIISKCLRVTKIKSEEKWYEFHFKGVWAGESLKRIFLQCSNDIIIKKNEEYLMYVRMTSLADGILRGVVIKSVQVKDCWDRS